MYIHVYILITWINNNVHPSCCALAPPGTAGCELEMKFLVRECGFQKGFWVSGKGDFRQGLQGRGFQKGCWVSGKGISTGFKQLCTGLVREISEGT